MRTVLERILERNVVKKDHRKVRLKVAICYPQSYRVGMSCLAIHLIYEMLNSSNEVVCERAFLPSTAGAAPHTLESNMQLSRMDIVAFSLQYETDYANVLRMLMDSGIPPRSKNRRPEDPLIIAGGPCATGNPEPLSDFVDIFAIGDAESMLPKLVDLALQIERPRAHLADFLDVEGLYLPQLDQDSVKRAWVRDLSLTQHPINQIVPQVDDGGKLSPIFGKTFLAEATRGCGHGCRFCYIGHIARPFRERRLDELRESLKQGTKRTGVNKVSLLGSGLSDYSHLEDICSWVVDDQKLKLSLASLRADSASPQLMEILARGGERTLTVAPEAGSQRLRDSLNKKVKDEDILQAAETALEAGLRNLKLYFMIGLPEETNTDIQDIISLTKRVAKLGYSSRAIRLSIAPFTPKPHTPFQWFPQAPLRDLETKLKMIRSGLGSQAKIDVETMDIRWARIQAVLSVADRTIGNVLERVAEAGGTLGIWKRALVNAKSASLFHESGIPYDTLLPWDKIDVGVSKDFLKNEKDKAARGEQSPSCIMSCSECGVC